MLQFDHILMVSFSFFLSNFNFDFLPTVYKAYSILPSWWKVFSSYFSFQSSILPLWFILYFLFIDLLFLPLPNSFFRYLTFLVYFLPIFLMTCITSLSFMFQTLFLKIFIHFHSISSLSFGCIFASFSWFFYCTSFM